MGGLPGLVVMAERARIQELRTWSPSSSERSGYIYASLFSGTPVYRVDTRRQRGPEVIVTTGTALHALGQNTPFREMQCTPAGRLRPDAFICAGFDFVSDIWMIENFESHKE